MIVCEIQLWAVERKNRLVVKSESQDIFQGSSLSAEKGKNRCLEW